MSQKISHTKPIAPVHMNACLHPYKPNIQGTTTGAITAPIFVPELNIPVASARSFLGNHSATALIAVGKFPASLIPRNALTAPNPNVDFTAACSIAAMLQKTTDTV